MNKKKSYRILSIFFMVLIVSSISKNLLLAQVISNQASLPTDSLAIQKIPLNPNALEPLAPKPCDVVLQKAIAYIANPVDLNPDRFIFDIPSQYHGKIEKVGNDYEIYFPKKIFFGHKLSFKIDQSPGSLYNYHYSYGRIPTDTLRNYDVWIGKSRYDYCHCYIEVKQHNGKTLYGFNSNNNWIDFSNMGWPDVDIGDYYDVNIYSFNNSGQVLEQSFKVHLKNCSVTDKNECP